ncbi:MAG: hypothetical protein BWZ02_02990 [Lentisphaerae bacterium ADurb.BinA184]|nr:MAG: hypothetical protein BWZ02_02990 [Lentisphaerae bacterium ADurb.BinA184]
MLFNPVGCERHETVEAILWENSRNWTGPSRHIPAFSVHTPDGDTLPAQTVETGSYWGHDFSRVAFPARVGAFGYALYTITEEKTADVPARAWQLGGEHHCAYSSRERQQEGLENDLVLVELDMTTGGIRRLVDKAGGVELISPQHPAPVLEYAVERSHGMSAWLVDHTGPAERPAVKSVRRKDRGPYKASLEVAWRIRSSDFTMVYELRAGDPNLYMSLSGTWFERGTPETGIPVLRLALPLALEGAKPSYEIPFGAVERQTVAGEEVPALQWARVTGRAGARQAGCLLANDGKHGHSLDGGTLRVTLIHSSYDPDPLPEIGRHEMQFALRPFAASAPVSEAIHAGQCLNHALRVVGTGVHKGSLPAVAELLTVSPKGVVLSGLKMAEDGQGLIARLFEPNGKAATATLELNPRLLGTVRRAVEVDLVERDLPASSARVAGNKVTVKVPARGIASLRIELAG